jgi:hypothetical protein
MGAKLFFGKPDGSDKIIQGLITETAEFQPLADMIDHGVVTV